MVWTRSLGARRVPSSTPGLPWTSFSLHLPEESSPAVWPEKPVTTCVSSVSGWEGQLSVWLSCDLTQSWFWPYGAGCGDVSENEHSRPQGSVSVNRGPGFSTCKMQSILCSFKHTLSTTVCQVHLLYFHSQLSWGERLFILIFAEEEIKAQRGEKLAQDHTKSIWIQEDSLSSQGNRQGGNQRYVIYAKFYGIWKLAIASIAGKGVKGNVN